MAAMTSNVQSASKAAFSALNNIGQRQTDVLSVIRTLGTACNQKIADYLGIPVNQVTGRVFELRKLGLVVEDHKGIWPATGRNVIWWAEVQPKSQLQPTQLPKAS
jgi:predicted transcriptional regulator